MRSVFLKEWPEHKGVMGQLQMYNLFSCTIDTEFAGVITQQ